MRDLVTGIRYSVRFCTLYGLRGVPAFARYARLRYGSGAGTVSLRLHGLATPLQLRRETSDADVFDQIFLQQFYDWGRFETYRGWVAAAYERALAEGTRPFILDAGANIGLSAIWYAARYPAALIYAIEPDEANFSMLRANVQGHDNIVPIKGALWNRRAKVEIGNAGAPAWSIRVRESTSGTIDAYGVADVMRMANATRILVAKIDIEGAEKVLFRENTDWMQLTDSIAIELHDRIAPGTGVARPFLIELCRRAFDVVPSGEMLFCFKVPNS